MNDQIRQLAEQVGAVRNVLAMGRHDGVLFTESELEKFAKLIVAECIEKVRGEFLPVLEDEAMMKDTHWDGYVQCGVDSVVAIREHFFGVEE